MYVFVKGIGTLIYFYFLTCPLVLFFTLPLVPFFRFTPPPALEKLADACWSAET